MDFFERYENACRMNNLDPCANSTASRFGIVKSTASAWKKRGTLPKCDVVRIIADELNVSADYLLGRTDDPTDTANCTAVPISLSMHEEILLKAYRAAPDALQQAVCDILHIERPTTHSKQDTQNMAI